MLYKYCQDPIYANAFWDVDVKPEILDTPRNSRHQPEVCAIYGKHYALSELKISRADPTKAC